MILILAILTVSVSTGANENDGAPGTIYSDWLNLESILDSREGLDLLSGTLRSGANRSAATHSNDLADFLDGIQIGAPQNDEGVYTILEGVPYTVQMRFSEKTNGVQFQGNVLTYHFPAGFTPEDDTGTFNVTGAGGDVRFDYSIIGDTLRVTIDESSPGYPYFSLSETVQFEIHATGVISQNHVEFSSEVTGEFIMDQSRDLSVQKVGEYDAAQNRVKFTIRAYSKGNNANVHIGDIISGEALIYDPGTLAVSSNVSNSVGYHADKRGEETFGLTVDSMVNGETVTVAYFADVDLSKLTPTGNGGHVTIDQTGNTVRISQDGGPPDHEITIHDDDFWNRITISTNSKTAASQTVREGKTYITWKIVLNEDANISLAGRAVHDVIDASCQQIMRYAGSGLHVEKYRKDGTPAGTSDIRWGTNGLTASGGGSTWTYTIPEADTESYKYVITYETEVDSDTLLKTTVVSNKVHNDFDTDYSGANVETTGVEVEAEKKAVQSTVDRANKTAETEWEITFTVPPAGLDSAVIIDSLPGYLDAAQNRWFWDTYKPGSVRAGAGDLLSGERFTVDSAPQDHQVVITFTKNDGTPGLTGNGLTRTIHVYLTTTASHDWLVYAEGAESRARTHVNNAIARLNGQDIHVTGSVNYQTSKYEIEKVFVNTYSTSTEPPLPIYVYKISLSGIDDDAFDAAGNLTITDTYDSDYLIFKSNYETYDGYSVNTPNGRVYGNNQHNQYGTMGTGQNVLDSSSEGQIVFKLNKNTLPKNESSYWSYYTIVYALQVKDAETLARMKEEALHADGLKVEMPNTAFNEAFGSHTIVTEYTINALRKELVSEEDNSGTGTHDLHFKITVNEEGLKIGDEDTVTLKDTLTNLSFDYVSIEVEPRLEGDVLNRTGNSVIFTLHNETPYTITYTARLIGKQNVHWSNKAELQGYVSARSGTSSLQSGGSGSYRTYSMNVKKYAEGNMNQGLAATFELYEARVKDASGAYIAAPQWVEIGEFTTDGTTGVYQISEVVRPGETEAQSLRPYSYHDENGIEQFGTGEAYGWRYRIKETAAPEGYQKTTVLYEFGISDIPYYAAPYNYLNGDTVTIVNTPIGLQVETEVRGEKRLIGKELEDQEFTFSIRPEESAQAAWGAGYPGGFDGTLTVRNDAAGRFVFPLVFTYNDYLNAQQKGFVLADGSTTFCYVVREELPEGAENRLWNGVGYDESQFLVKVRLYIDGSQLKTELSYSQYDGPSAATVDG